MSCQGHVKLLRQKKVSLNKVFSKGLEESFKILHGLKGLECFKRASNEKPISTEKNARKETVIGQMKGTKGLRVVDKLLKRAGQ